MPPFPNVSRVKDTGNAWLIGSAGVRIKVWIKDKGALKGEGFFLKGGLFLSPKVMFTMA